MSTTVIIGTSIVATIVIFLIALCCKGEPYKVNDLDETVFKKKENVYKSCTYYDEEDEIPDIEIPRGWIFFL